MSRATWILLTASILLSLEVYFFENSPAPWIRVGKVFPEVVAQEVYEVEINRRTSEQDAKLGIAAEHVRLRYEGQPASWWIVEPIRCPAFHPRVMGIVWDLVDVVRVAEAAGGDRFFPDGPAITIRFKTRFSGDKEIEIGMDHPDDSLDFCYARVGKDVFVTRKEFRKTMTVSLNELRGRALVPVPASDANSLLVEGGPGPARKIERVGKSYRWRLREPLDALADRELIKHLLEDLNAWTVAEFIKDGIETPGDLEPYGLASPSLTVTVGKMGGRPLVLEIGKEFQASGVGMVYVRHAGQPFVYSAVTSEKGGGGDLLERLRAPAEDYRSRFVFQVGPEDIVAFRLQGGGKEIRIDMLKPAERSEGKESTPARRRWEVADVAAGETFEGDRSTLEILTSELRELLVQKFVGDEVPLGQVGLEPPRVRLEVTLSGGDRRQLFLGDLCEDAEYKGLGFYHASRPGEPGSYLVSTRIPDYFRAGAQVFRRRDISRLDASKLTEFKVLARDRVWYLARVPGEPWMLSMDTPLVPGKFLNQETVGRLLARLGSGQFAVQSFVPRLKDYAAYSLELTSPRRAVVFLQPRDLPGFHKLVLGELVQGEEPLRVYARVDLDSTPAFTLPEDDIPRRFDVLVKHLREITGAGN